MSDKDKLLRRYARWFADVCEAGLDPDVIKRERLRLRIRAQQMARRLGRRPIGWGYDG